MLTHLSLFSGIGGIDLAAEWAGFTTVGQCEWADYPTKVLEKHWPDVPRWRDIRELTYDKFVERTGLHTVDLISGGFPCQPFSVAGKQKGKGDDRYLWPEMLRVIRELTPSWVIGENVPGILQIAGKTVCEDLEREGYAIAVFNFEAAAVGAKHRRERVFFMANARCRNITGDLLKGSDAEKNKQGNANKIERPGGSPGFMADTDHQWQLQQKRCVEELGGRAGNGGQDVADTNGKGLQGGQDTRIECKEREESFNEQFSRCNPCGNHWAAEPNVGRVANGIPNRVDRIKCLGNAVVPQQVYPILKAIAEIERGG